jgi:hypothetical protein
MFGVIDVTVLAISVTCGIGALVTLVASARSRAEAKHESRREAALGQHVALTKLDKWRHTGVLVMSDRDYKLAVSLGKHDPEQLDDLVEFVHGIIDEGPEPKQRVKLTAQVAYDEHEERAKSADHGVARGHLELIAAFS